MNLTVITVCFNAKYDLRKTLDSVLEQTYMDMEYLVVDGGSNDGTVELLNEYSVRFERKSKKFRYISEKDKGTYDAMNKGALLAQGVWINYMNAGDIFYSNDSLKTFFSHEIKESIGVAYGNTLQEYDFGSGIATPKDYNSEVMPFCHQSCFVRTCYMQKYLFDLSYKIVADHDLFYRICKDGIQYQYIPVVVARYNGQYGLSATHPFTLHKEMLRIYHITEKWFYPFALVWCYMRYGWVQPFKDNMPRWMTDAWMKHKRKYIKNSFQNIWQEDSLLCLIALFY